MLKYFLIGCGIAIFMNLLKGLTEVTSLEPGCDGDCLGCKHFEVDCDGDDFTDWLLYEADDNEY